MSMATSPSLNKVYIGGDQGVLTEVNLKSWLCKSRY